MTDLRDQLPIPTPESAAHALRAAREHRHLSQQQLADLIGRSQATVWRHEGGHHIPKLASLIRHAHALGYRLALIPCDDEDQP